MSKNPPPTPRFTVITLGVSDIRASIVFYESLGFVRKMRATGDAVAFFDTGGTVLALFPWDQLAADAALPDQPRQADGAEIDQRHAEAAAEDAEGGILGDHAHIGP
jgi:catechol 2,3-dioxygenase-like lactoylglutathione lyase family enzyme